MVQQQELFWLKTFMLEQVVHILMIFMLQTIPCFLLLMMELLEMNSGNQTEPLQELFF